MTQSPGNGSAGNVQEAGSNSFAIFCRILSDECDEDTTAKLKTHSQVLVNATDAALRSPHGEKALRNFFRFVGVVSLELAEERAVNERLRENCEVLRRQLLAERDGRNAEGFRLAVGAINQKNCFEKERQANVNLQSRLESFRSQMTYSFHQQQRQTAEFLMMRKTLADVELDMEQRLRDEVFRQQELAKEGHKTAMDHLRNQCEQKLLQARRAESMMKTEMQQEHAAAVALRDERAKLETALEPLRLLRATHCTAILDMTRFLEEESTEIQSQFLPRRCQVPVLALEWPLMTSLDTSISWENMTSKGMYGLFHALCTGDLRLDSECLEITACCVNGRWLGALHGEVEVPRLAALLLYQGLRPDINVRASCRVVPMKPSLVPKGVLELDPARRSAAPVGVGRVMEMESNPRWTVPVHPRAAIPVGPEADEALLRSFLVGSPMERELISALSYVRAIHPDALRRAQPANTG